MKAQHSLIASTKTASSREGHQALEKQLLLTQIKKTQLCRYYAAGACQLGRACSFAHGASDLKAAPELKKTRICRGWLAGKCDKSTEECKFAHGRKDVKTTPFLQLRLPGNETKTSRPGLGTHELHTHSVQEALKAKILPKSDVNLNDTPSTCAGIDEVSSSNPSEIDQNDDCCQPEAPAQAAQDRIVLMSPLLQWLTRMKSFLASASTDDRAMLVKGLQMTVPEQYHD